MAPTDPSLTPEKRLLQLIEGTETEEEQQTRQVKESFFSRFQVALSPEKIQALVKTLQKKLTAVLQGKEYVSLSEVNRFAKVFTVGLGIALALSMVYELTISNNQYVSNLHVPEAEVDDIAMSETKIFDTDLVRRADKVTVFIPPSQRVTEKVEEKPKVSLQLADMIKEWKLAGISIYPEEEGSTFCMIEDLKKNITTFLKKGDTIAGLTVTDIRPDGVTLVLGEESIELR